MSVTQMARPGPGYVPDPTKPDTLSARERDVVMLISEGYSNQEIAAELYLSINSVKTYIRAAYRKLGITRRSQAVIWGFTRALHALAPDQADLAAAAPSDERLVTASRDEQQRAQLDLEGTEPQSAVRAGQGKPRCR